MIKDSKKIAVELLRKEGNVLRQFDTPTDTSLYVTRIKIFTIDFGNGETYTEKIHMETDVSKILEVCRGTRSAHLCFKWKFAENQEPGFR